MSIAAIDALIQQAGIKYFRASDVVVTYKGIPDRSMWSNIIPTLRLADKIREGWGSGVYVTSGYRSPEYNDKVGGAKKSMHMQFRATDIRPTNGRIAEFRTFVKDLVLAERKAGANIGLGLYPRFVHIDVDSPTGRNRNWNFVTNEPSDEPASVDESAGNADARCDRSPKLLAGATVAGLPTLFMAYAQAADDLSAGLDANSKAHLNPSSDKAANGALAARIQAATPQGDGTLLLSEFQAVLRERVKSYVRPLPVFRVSSDPWGSLTGDGPSLYTTLDTRDRPVQPVYAVADGVVASVTNLNGTGLTVIIDHGDGISTRYMHLGELRVTPLATVRKAQVIAMTSATPPVDVRHRVRYPHMLFALRFLVDSNGSAVTSEVGNQSVDPAPVFAVAPSPVAPAEVVDPVALKLEESRNKAAQVALQAPTAPARAQAEGVMDSATAQQRGKTLANALRRDYYDAHAHNDAVLSSRARKSSQVSPDKFE